jgi:5'-deoxynucleotidase YfbR-like HD superfamily hydrolase
MGARKKNVLLTDIADLLLNGYVPFAEIERAITWPTDPDRRGENDAEHSFSLALIAGAVADRLGLDAGLAAQFGLLHDFVELYAGDTSVWDVELAKTKAQREKSALGKIKQRHGNFPWLGKTIERYEALDTEEACLVYALDKLAPLMIVEAGNGHFWIQNGISWQDHQRMVAKVRPKIARHAAVLSWYDEMLEIVAVKRADFFAK